MASYISKEDRDISNEDRDEIKSIITKETNKLNECVIEWYKKNLEPKDLQEFEGCCNEEEIELLIKCYTIFSKHYNGNILESVDKDVIKACIAYYYNVGVFENYIHEMLGEKYLKIVKEEDSKAQNNKIFTDNNDNIYGYYWIKSDDKEDFIEVEEISDEDDEK